MRPPQTARRVWSAAASLCSFKLGLPGRDTACNHGGVLLVQRGLSLFLRPILPVCDAVLAAVRGRFGKAPPGGTSHDFGLEVAQGRVGTAVLAPGFRVGWPVHVGQERVFLYPQRIDNDMHMDIAAVVMPVRVGAYKGLVAGKCSAQNFSPIPAPGLRSGRCPGRPVGQS